ncbi:MAG: AAA family ATPase [Desulfuromonadales bacterium]|nr:AAA family ATPase [Desulfuromonadales bacterium]
MRLNSLAVYNFRLFNFFTIEFHPKLTVIVAPNGGGKTAILDAIRIALGPYLSVFPTGKNSGVENDDIRQVKTLPEIGQMADALPVAIHATGCLSSSKTEEWYRERVSRKGKTTIKDAKQLMAYGRRLQSRGANNESAETWPLIAYYGTGRLWDQLKLSGKKLFKTGFHTRAAGYQDCMTPASSYKFFIEWFMYATRADNQAKLRAIEQSRSVSQHDLNGISGPFSILLRAVDQAVGTVLNPTGWANLQFSETLEMAIIEHPEQGVLAVGQMSDGIRNTIALVADIAWRCVQLNAHLGDAAVKETEGIVLIDEVDMHLHPEWQQLIVGSLREAFPRIQFIVTTHSPQVLTTVDAESIRRIHPEVNETGVVVCIAKQPEEQTKGVASAHVMALNMNTDPVPPVVEARWLSDYRALIQQGLHESHEGSDLRGKLVAHFGEGHPEILECDRLIRLETFKRSLPSRSHGQEG